MCWKFNYGHRHFQSCLATWPHSWLRSDDQVLFFPGRSDLFEVEENVADALKVLCLLLPRWIVGIDRQKCWTRLGCAWAAVRVDRFRTARNFRQKVSFSSDSKGYFLHCFSSLWLEILLSFVMNFLVNYLQEFDVLSRWNLLADGFVDSQQLFTV